MVTYKSQFKSVVCHKIAERRMDGSAGGAFGALAETVVKEDYYFAGPVYDDFLHVHHIVTNDPEKILLMDGRKITESNCSGIFPEIKELLAKEEHVLFSGTPCQCKELVDFLGSVPDNLILIDMYCTGVYDDDLIDRFVSDLKHKYGSDVNNIRFYNKEYFAENPKRITLSNGRTYYTHKQDTFDEVLNSGVYLKDKCKNCPFAKLNERCADISIGIYGPITKVGDKMGYSIISVNSDKGKTLYDKALRRFVVYKDKDIDEESIPFKPRFSNKSFTYYKDKDLTCDPREWRTRTSKEKIKQIGRIVLHLKRISQSKLGPIFKFIKYNFFTKGVKTSFWEDGYFYIAPYCAIEIAKSAQIVLHGPLEIGVKRVKSSKLETRLWMLPNTKILVHEKCMFGYGSNVEMIGHGLLEVGNLFSNAPITIVCSDYIKFGNTVNIAKDSTVRDTNGHFIANQGTKTVRPVEIGNHTWVASGSMIMPGVTIGDGCIVGSSSYVNKSKKSFTISQGQPAEAVSTVKYFNMN